MCLRVSGLVRVCARASVGVFIRSVRHRTETIHVTPQNELKHSACL